MRKEVPVGAIEEREEAAVLALGKAFGYGRVMQLCEQLWSEMPLVPKGGALSVGPCVGMLVTCPCPEKARGETEHCDWCCGTRRVTKRVFQAMQAN